MNDMTPRSFSGSAAATEAASGVAATLESLRVFRGEVEGVFVRLGDGLERTLDKVERLREELDAAVKKVKGDQGNSIFEYIGSLEKATGERFAGNSEVIEFCIGLMKKNVENLAEIEKKNREFVASWTRMNAIALYFSIESSRTEAASSLFATYARDIRSLFGEMIEVVHRIGQEVEQNSQNQISAIKVVTADYESVVKDSRSAIKQSYATITGISSVSMETLERVTRYFSLLGRSVARILTAIQVGDITRQQLEHIVTSLEEAAGFAGSGGTVDVDRARVIALQYAQLKHVRREIADAHATIAESVEQIAAAFGILAADVNDLMSGARGASGDVDWVTALTGEMEKMWHLERAGAKVVDHTLATIDNAFGSSQMLKNHVGRIADHNRRLSMEAYNARILSMRLGDEGRSLITLAKEVSEISRATQGYMNDVTRVVGGIIAIAEQAVRKIEVMRQGFGSARDYDEGGGQTRNDLDDLGRETSQFAKMTVDACANAKDLNIELHFVEEGVTALGALGLRLDSSLEALGAVVAGLNGQFGDSLGKEWTAGEELIERYTMENERLIHRQLAAGDQLSEVAIDSSVGQRNEMVVSDDEMGENVELF